MSARIDVANIALTWLGEKPITSLEDDSFTALVMKTNYDLAREATLEAHEWSFAIKRWEGAKDADAPAWGASNRFIIPLDIMRVVAVEPVNGSLASAFNTTKVIGRRPQADWVVESGYILTDEDAIYCKGIRHIKDEGIYSPLFVHAFAAHLAMLTAYTFTESNVKFNAMSALYQLKIQEAKTRDGLQGSSKRMRNRSLENVR